MRILLCLIVLSLSGCATLKDKVFTQIHDGDSQESVLGKLGNPESFTKTSQGMLLTYTKGREICDISLEAKGVVSTSCKKTPKKEEKNFFEAFSDGYRQSTQNSTYCTSTAFGNTVTTNCN